LAVSENNFSLKLLTFRRIDAVDVCDARLLLCKAAAGHILKFKNYQLQYGN